MTADRKSLGEFCRLVTGALGLWFDEHRLGFLADVLRERCEARGEEPASYLHALKNAPSRAEWQNLASRLTVGETYFLRGGDHFGAFVDVVLPRRIRQSAPGERLRFLSAGCSSGEEACSLAMMLREYPNELADRETEIVGVDINREILEKARAGEYSEWSLRETPPDLRNKYFGGPNGRTLRPEIHSMVSFREGNLSRADEWLWQEGAFDAVFCRNVLMYMGTETAAAVVGRIHRVLKPGGYLFLGHAETLRGVSQSFHLQRHGGAFYYQAKLPDEEMPPAETVFSPGFFTKPTPEFEITTEWMDQIGRASTRIATLASSTFRDSLAPTVERRAPSRRNLNLVFDLHRQERFTEALAQLEGLTDAGPADAGLRVLQANLLVGCGRFEEAEAICQSLLGNDEMDAGAHYVAALCREQAGDLGGAEEHDAAAVHLDPTFAMPRFHLGRLFVRLGRRPEALAHFEAAPALFMKEDSTRLLLFGGGFSRESLMQVCRSEIRRLKAA